MKIEVLLQLYDPWDNRTSQWGFICAELIRTPSNDLMWSINEAGNHFDRSYPHKKYRMYWLGMFCSSLQQSAERIKQHPNSKLTKLNILNRLITRHNNSEMWFPFKDSDLNLLVPFDEYQSIL